LDNLLKISPDALSKMPAGDVIKKMDAHKLFGVPLEGDNPKPLSWPVL
jgi:hypothetical protein